MSGAGATNIERLASSSRTNARPPERGTQAELSSRSSPAAGQRDPATEPAWSRSEPADVDEIDAHVQHANEIGEKNAETIELLAAHCRNARVELGGDAVLSPVHWAKPSNARTGWRSLCPGRR